ncbi:hypothetical protein [Mesorhizobium sanjuanii]|uniref:hypothetical protein n=1 Tax=Mesorhizobium sanjuanii TaxID=2037900 RepID=UPI0013FDE4AB|nr:hypothetical protein [Mesorhizobium sanjuanii]
MADENSQKQDHRKGACSPRPAGSFRRLSLGNFHRFLHCPYPNGHSKRVAFERIHATHFKVLVLMHVVIAKPLRTFARHAFRAFGGGLKAESLPVNPSAGDNP